MGRKSVVRVDKKPAKKVKDSQLVIDLGIENFKDDLKPVHKAVSLGFTTLVIDLIRADNAHLPDKAERFCYKPTTNYNVVYIPVNRLKQVYQTDEALNPAKVKENRRKMREGVPLDPVEIGYNYDVHDGHHRWEAAIEEGHTHVPCVVRGTEPAKVKAAIAEYKKIWKSDAILNSIEDNIQENIIANIGYYIVDLSKGTLNTAKLVKKRVAVKGKMGKVFYRMQWVDPNDKNPAFQSTGKNESTYHHHEHEVKDLEKRQSNRFPVVHHPVADLKNTHRNYVTDKQKYAEAHKDYHEGKQLAPVKVNDKGEILDNHHLVDLARKLGLSHVPSLIMGNTEGKKKLEESLKDKVMTHEDGDDESKIVPATNGGRKVDNHPDVATFRDFTAKKYTKQHIMDEARKQGINWKRHTEQGEILEDHNSIMWMRAFQAIVNHINAGNKFEVEHKEKEIDKRMSQDGWDSIQKHFLRLLEKQGGKQNLMEWARKNNITWKENADANINWMRAATEIKKELAKGTMVDGVRTRQKAAMETAHLVITDQIKSMVKELSQKYSKQAIMDKASQLGIEYSIFDSKGAPLPANSPILWMRASSAVQTYIAKGNTFAIGEDNYEDNGIAGNVGDYAGAKLARVSRVAVDLGKRNSQNFELKAKEWALAAFKADYGEHADAHLMYDQLMHGARKANVIIHFDPTEKLASGVSLLDQLSSDGKLKNNWELNKVGDPEEMGINERELFGYDFDEASHSERPNYGVIDLFNQGLKSSPYGGAAFVLKQDAKKRTTGVHTDSSNLEYETNGKLTRGMEDPHHLIVDRWMTKWKNPSGKDAKRTRLMKSIMDGTRSNDDGDYFETHVHGGVDMRKDVEHILVPHSWQSDDNHKEKHEKLKQFSQFMGVPIKYE